MSVSELARHSNARPFAEARFLWDDRLKAKVPEKGYVLFETGYGPSGLPHIGTFGEVVRTTMVRRAFEAMVPGVKTRLFAFSDDMDGLRKVPDNVPNQEMMAQHLGKPLTSIPDPFGTHDSFGAHNNARLRAFLNSFGFEYEFQSATETYKSGAFDKALLRVLEKYDEVINVILPTLGPDRRATYSPFLPVDAKTGLVLQVPIVHRDLKAGTVVYEQDGKKIEVPVTGGHCKLQWKCDWAMRWYALGVDYEMSGKDLIDFVKLSGQICRILGGAPPANLTFELFLDEQGQKISKSKGNGLSVEDWLKYAPAESLALYMYQKPKTAKRLFFDVIPKTVDEYLDHLAKYAAATTNEIQLDNPVWHIHHGKPPVEPAHLGFGILLNLVGVANADEPGILWQYISRYAPGATPATAPLLDRMVHHALSYYRDFVKPTKVFKQPSPDEAAALKDLRDALSAHTGERSPEALQNLVFEVGKRHPLFANLRDWFKALYQILLGQEQGPRMGSFIALYGVPETVRLIDRALAGEDLAA